jgi:hypothetical protein
MAQLAGTLWTHQRLEKYQTLIQQAFGDSLWNAAAAPQLERNSELIWRISIALYESTFDASPGRIYTCEPNGSDEFDCHNEFEPASIVPIPTQVTPAVSVKNQPDSL